MEETIQSMELAQNYKTVKENVTKACEQAGRSEQEVTLLAVSKTKPVDMLMDVYRAGARDFGENKVQELVDKIPQMPSDVRWHMIGHLQRNKVKQVVGKVALIQSIGSPELLAEVDKQAEKLGIVQDILLEVNIGGEAAKSGFAPQEVENAAAQAKKMDHVRVRGLMTIPPADATREENVVYFQKVQALYVDINRKMYDNGLEYLSMGMSGDFADAIRAGANMVRVGTAIFGARDYSK